MGMPGTPNICRIPPKANESHPVGYHPDPEANMPDPLHPAIVHFPVVLALFLPPLALWALLLILRGRSARRTWARVVLAAGLLSLSAWAAVETGEEQEEAVESVVPESAIHEHEEAAELLLGTSAVLLLLMAGGLAPGRVGSVARYVAAPASLVLLLLAFRVGDTGGSLVYTHGAASAYVSSSGGGAEDLPRGRREREGDDDDDDRH